MATITEPDAAREPSLALGIAFERTVSGLASIADVAMALEVLTALIGDEWQATLDTFDPHVGAITALAVIEHESAPLIITGSYRGALRSSRRERR